MFDRLTAGVAYYPEHWPKELWQDDLRRMKKAGIEAVRVAEFAWAIFEPADGVFDFTMFDAFLDLAAREGVRVIMGTPTATPPAWLTQAHPEVLNRAIDGSAYQHGLRRHYNYSSPVYKLYTARIVEQLARRYGHHPAVIGWQIDNELNCELDVFYAERDHEAFRAWLKERYGTLARLNEAWGTTFWSETYTDWEQVHLPRKTPNDSLNPHQALDEKRFISENCIRFAELQSRILREHIAPGQFVTTNGMFGHLDSHALTERALDWFTYDSYPNFGTFVPTADGDRSWSVSLDRVRSVCPHFGIMEQQSGAGSWHDRMRSRAPRPGQARLWAFQSAAHGADYISFFRWRTCTYGNEIYWHGILSYDNRDNRRLAEITRFISDMRKIGNLAGAEYVSEVGMLFDYDNEWDGERDVYVGGLRRDSEAAITRAAAHLHTPIDHVCMDHASEEQLGKYRVLIWPHPTIVSEEAAKKLERYTAAGGTLILGARSGYKDTDGHCPMTVTPGLLRGLAGVEVDDFTLLQPDLDDVTVCLGDTRLKAAGCCDLLTPVTARPIAVFESAEYPNGDCAAAENRFGKGVCVYYGSGFTDEVLKALLERYGALTPAKDVLELPDSCELTIREKDGKRWYFALNYGAETAVTLKEKMTDLLTGETLEGSVKMDRYGVRVLMKA